MRFSQSWDCCPAEHCFVLGFRLNRFASHHVPHGCFTFMGSHERRLLPSPRSYRPLSDRLDGMADSGLYRCLCKAELCECHPSSGGISVIRSSWAASPACGMAALLSTNLHIQFFSITEGRSWWVAKPPGTSWLPITQVSVFQYYPSIVSYQINKEREGEREMYEFVGQLKNRKN